MNAQEALEGREGNVGDVSNKIDLVMAADTNESKKTTTMTINHLLMVMTLQKKGAEIMPDIDIEENVEQRRWDYTNK